MYGQITKFRYYVLFVGKISNVSLSGDFNVVSTLLTCKLSRAQRKRIYRSKCLAHVEISLKTEPLYTYPALSINQPYIKGKMFLLCYHNITQPHHYYYYIQSNGQKCKIVHKCAMCMI